MKKNKKVLVFRRYDQNQQMMFPPAVEDFIPADHPVRLLNNIINKLNLDFVYQLYDKDGAPAYDPKIMIKILFFAYMQNIYSSRKIEAAVKENVNFMWLAAMQKPDHNTINNFRSKRLQPVLKQIFSEIVIQLNQAGQLTLKDIYTDGTKIEANANKYTFVWGKAMNTQKGKMLERINALWDFTEAVTKQEQLETRPKTTEELTPERVSEIIDQLNKSLEGFKIDNKKKAQLRYAKKNYPDMLERYKKQEEKLGGRNSYSKTDKDATFMRMKEDHMNNGQLKPGYNWQISTNNQYIVNYSTHQTAGDTTTLIHHLLEFEKLYGTMPDQLTADAGYGSEENYSFAEENDIEAFIKYNYFHKEQKSEFKQDMKQAENLHYNEEEDCFYCPMGQQMRKVCTKTSKTLTGFEQEISFYRAQNCKGCPMRGKCHKGEGNRTIQVNHNLRRLRKKAREKLNSGEGLEKRSRRPIEPEAVFGNIKHNKNFKRLMLRGMKKVEIELGLMAIAHNLSKMAA